VETRANETYLESFFVPESALEDSVVGLAVVVVEDLVGAVVVGEGVSSFTNELVYAHCEVETAWVKLIMGDEVVVGGINGCLHRRVEVAFGPDESVDWDDMPLACSGSTNMLVDGNKKVKRRRRRRNSGERRKDETESNSNEILRSHRLQTPRKGR
jgi:hypothetical protein